MNARSVSVCRGQPDEGCAGIQDRGRGDRLLKACQPWMWAVEIGLLVQQGVRRRWLLTVYQDHWRRFRDLSYNSTRLLRPLCIPSAPTACPSLTRLSTRFSSLRWCFSMVLSSLPFWRVAQRAGRWWTSACGLATTSISLLNWTLQWWSWRISLMRRESWCWEKASRDLRRLLTRWLLAMSTLCLRLRMARCSLLWNSLRSLASWIMRRSRWVCACISCVATRVVWALRSLSCSTRFRLSITLNLRWSSSPRVSSSWWRQVSSSQTRFFSQRQGASFLSSTVSLACCSCFDALILCMSCCTFSLISTSFSSASLCSRPARFSRLTASICWKWWLTLLWYLSSSACRFLRSSSQVSSSLASIFCLSCCSQATICGMNHSITARSSSKLPMLPLSACWCFRLFSSSSSFSSSAICPCSSSCSLLPASDPHTSSRPLPSSSSSSPSLPAHTSSQSLGRRQQRRWRVAARAVRRVWSWAWQAGGRRRRVVWEGWEEQRWSGLVEGRVWFGFFIEQNQQQRLKGITPCDCPSRGCTVRISSRSAWPTRCRRRCTPADSPPPPRGTASRSRSRRPCCGGPPAAAARAGRPRAAHAGRK